MLPYLCWIYFFFPFLKHSVEPTKLGKNKLIAETRSVVANLTCSTAMYITVDRQDQSRQNKQVTCSYDKMKLQFMVVKYWWIQKGNYYIYIFNYSNIGSTPTYCSLPLFFTLCAPDIWKQFFYLCCFTQTSLCRCRYQFQITSTVKNWQTFLIL